MCQKVICYYDEKLIWCEIMPKLLENRAEGKEKDQGEEDSEGNGEP